MRRKIGDLPLKRGDTVVLKTGETEKKGTVTRGDKRKAVVNGSFGKAVLTLRSKKGDAELTIDVDQHDEDGRELLLDA